MSTFYVEKYIGVRQSAGSCWSASDITRTNLTVSFTEKTRERDLCRKLRELDLIPKDSDMRLIKFSSFDSEIVEVKRKLDSMPYIRLVKKKF